MKIVPTTPAEVSATNSQVNIYHNYPPHIPPSVTVNGMPATAETINHHAFSQIDALQRELDNKNEIIDLLRDQINYWRDKYNKLKQLL